MGVILCLFGILQSLCLAMGLAHGIPRGLDQEEPTAMMPPTLQQFSNHDADTVIVIEDTLLSPVHEVVIINTTADICLRRMKRRRVLDNLVQKFHAQQKPVPDSVKELVVHVFSDALCDQMPKRQFESKMYAARRCLLLSD